MQADIFAIFFNGPEMPFWEIFDNLGHSLNPPEKMSKLNKHYSKKHHKSNKPTN